MSPESVELIALRRVSANGVTVHDGGYVHAGRPIGGELAEALVRLHTAGHLSIGAPGPDGHRPVALTVAGAARFADSAAASSHLPPTRWNTRLRRR